MVVMLGCFWAIPLGAATDAAVEGETRGFGGGRGGGCCSSSTRRPMAIRVGIRHKWRRRHGSGRQEGCCARRKSNFKRFASTVAANHRLGNSTLPKHYTSNTN